MIDVFWWFKKYNYVKIDEKTFFESEPLFPIRLEQWKIVLFEMSWMVSWFMFTNVIDKKSAIMFCEVSSDSPLILKFYFIIYFWHTAIYLIKF